MRVLIDMSDELVTVDGVMCRIWNGHAENGVPVRLYVHRVAVPIQFPQGIFEKDLIVVDPPNKEEPRR